MNITQHQLKQLAKSLALYSKDTNQDIRHTTVLEHAAKVLGFRNYSALNAAFQKERLSEDEEILLDLFSFTPFNPAWNRVTKEEFFNADKIILGHFTTSKFLTSILENGLQPVSVTQNYSSDDMVQAGDENYIYLAANYDRVFSKNAVEKHGGEEILLIVSVERKYLELDDLMQKYSSKNISLDDKDILYDALTSDLYPQCRTKYPINPDNIISILSAKDNEFLYKKVTQENPLYSDIKKEKLFKEFDVNML
jgi:hypothetical protein